MTWHERGCHVVNYFERPGMIHMNSVTMNVSFRFTQQFDAVWRRLEWAQRMAWRIFIILSHQDSPRFMFILVFRISHYLPDAYQRAISTKQQKLKLATEERGFFRKRAQENPRAKHICVYMLYAIRKQLAEVGFIQIPQFPVALTKICIIYYVFQYECCCNQAK